MSKPAVYLDLDRTLFQTNRIGEIWRYIADHHSEVDAERERQRVEQFRIWCDDLFCYDMSAQLSDLGLEASNIYRELLASPLADGRLQYEGVDSLVAFLKDVAAPTVLTYGIDDYQRFKAGLCPALEGIPVVTTRTSKSLYLRDVKGDAWLIDDKPIGEDLPTSVRFIQVSMEKAPDHHRSGASWPLYGSLREVEEYLRQELNIATL